MEIVFKQGIFTEEGRNVLIDGGQNIQRITYNMHLLCHFFPGTFHDFPTFLFLKERDNMKNDQS